MKDGSHSFYGDRKQVSVWRFDKERVQGHTTPKPVALIERAIQNSSKSGDLISDLFGGSGSTLIACEKTGRIARLMELDPKYCDVIVKRWQDFTGKQATLESTGQTYSELTDKSEIQNG
jgi:DNA modification methylase